MVALVSKTSALRGVGRFDSCPACQISGKKEVGSIEDMLYELAFLERLNEH